MDTIEKARIRYFHKQCMLKGESSQWVGWKSTAAQVNRFEALCQFNDLQGSVVLDVGCGTGDLKEYLDKWYAAFVYLGIDLLPDFIATAKLRYADKENTFFMQADFITDGLPEVDHIIASGALSYYTDDILFPYSAIVKLFSVVRRSLSFNLLDAEVFAPSDWLKAYCKDEVVNFCKRMTPKVDVITDYEEDDFTIVMYK